MKILSAAQIREWDAYTIQHEPISEQHLIERAASRLFDWILTNIPDDHNFKIFCGKGNNGNDGLALAKLLKPHTVTVYKVDSGEPFPVIEKNDIIIDAIFGTGLNKPPEGIYQQAIEFINQQNAITISVDIPSGMYADTSIGDGPVVRADHTLTFQQPKLAFIMAENADHFGEIHVLDIGLHPEFLNHVNEKAQLIDKDIIALIYKKRRQFTHKGNFGHAALLVGSYGLMGAAVLAVKACARSGAGKVTAVIPKIGYDIMQVSVPEAMSKVSGANHLAEIDSLEKFDAVGVGPGIGLYESLEALMNHLFTANHKPIVIDADALNIIAQNEELCEMIPPGSIITPHTVEFDRLFGKMENDFQRMEVAIASAIRMKISIVLKGHRTMIVTPEGKVYFNSTGNAGMATGGSGDVLTGILTSLLAQQYSPVESCLLGVYLHGLAGDISAEKWGQEALLAGDIIDSLGAAYKSL